MSQDELVTDIRGFLETLKIQYEMYKDTVDEGYQLFSYEEWLEMKVFWLTEENKKKTKLHDLKNKK